MLPSYSTAIQQQQEPDLESEQQQPSFHRSYQGLHQQQQPQQHQPQHQPQHQQQHQQQISAPASVKDGILEINAAFLQSPAGGLLAVSSILGLVIGICGAVPLWSQLAGGAFCVFSGLLHFCGGSFLFFAYLYNFVQAMPWYTRILALYYYMIGAGVSLIAFVYSASCGQFHSPAIASAVFAFLTLGVDIVLLVLSYMALKLGYSTVQSGPEAAA